MDIATSIYTAATAMILGSPAPVVNPQMMDDSDEQEDEEEVNENESDEEKEASTCDEENHELSSDEAVMDNESMMIVPMKMEVDEVVVPFVPQAEETEHTLCELASMAFPDGNFAPLHTIVVGDASTGKTMLVLSLVLQQLEKDASCTDEMKSAILQVLPTGAKLTTRRPTEVHLKRQAGQCSMTLRLPVEKITCKIGHDDGDTFPFLFERLNRFHGDEIFKEPLVIEITSAFVPNLKFTDLPGLRRGGNEFHICDPHTGKTIEPRTGLKDLYREMMFNPDNSVVIIDTAGPNSDIEGCQAQTIALNIQNGYYGDAFHDPNIMNRCILGLSKCDTQTILHFYKNILPRVVPDPDIPKQGPFQTVCLICKSQEGEVEFSNATLQEVSQELVRVQAEQKQYFDNINQLIVEKGQLERFRQLSPQQHFSLEALIDAMNSMLFRKMDPALRNCGDTLLGFRKQLEMTMFERLAPSPEIYINNHSVAREMLAEFREGANSAIRDVVCRAYFYLKKHRQLPHPPRDLVQYSDLFLLQRDRDDLACSRQTYFDNLHLELRNKVNETLASSLSTIFDIKSESSVFTARYSSFHRLYRFTNLVHRLQQGLLQSIDQAIDQVLRQLSRQFDGKDLLLADIDEQEVGKFIDVCCEKIRVGIILAVRKSIESLISSLSFDEMLLQESEEFQVERRELVQQYCRAQTQLNGMEHCLHAVGNRQDLSFALRDCCQTLQELSIDAYARLDPTKFEISFWKEELIKRDGAHMFVLSGAKRKEIQHIGSSSASAAAAVVVLDDDEDDVKTDDGYTSPAARVYSSDDDDALSMDEEESGFDTAHNKRKREY